MQKYKILKTLGDGAFGTVFKAINLTTRQIVAIKKFKQKYPLWQQCIELRQVKALLKLNHPNIIKLKEVLQVTDELYLIFEFGDINLFEFYSQKKDSRHTISEDQIRDIAYQITSALAFMHKNGFFHRDIKPENILIYDDKVKICDLGLSREIRSKPPFTQYVSTRWYRAPQLLLHSTNYNAPVDIFALGCIIAELYLQNPLFPGGNEIDQLNKIVKILGKPDKQSYSQGYKLAANKGYCFEDYQKIDLKEKIPNASKEAIDLMELTFQYQPRKRPTAAQLLNHPYFHGITFSIPEFSPSSQIIFGRKPEGIILNTNKRRSKHHLYKLTKSKFFSTKPKIFYIQNQEEESFEQIQEKYHEQRRDKEFVKFDTTDKKVSKRFRTDATDSIDVKRITQKNSQQSNNIFRFPNIQRKSEFKPNQYGMQQFSVQLSNKTLYKPLLGFNISKISRKQKSPFAFRHKQFRY